MTPGIMNLFLKHIIPTASTHVKPSIFGEGFGSSSSSSSSSSIDFDQTTEENNDSASFRSSEKNNNNNQTGGRKVSKYAKTENDILFKVLDSGGSDRGGSELFSSRNRLFFGE
jgi:hypothetical protein